ncbi:guanylyltransferase [Chloroflexia bacterium SDU3-3]|nr:guanylyltransferase [Chloroflexia bacterium SDU3-3]
MHFDELDRQMRVFETINDQYALPGIFLVVRLDGRNFTRLTKETHQFQAPFDERMRDYMVETTAHLMQCGFRVIYGYTQSDKISLLLDPSEETFGRKMRKINSILAGEASAKCSLLLGDIAAFDCRVAQLPSLERVVDYFRWREEDAHRNALNGHCYWMLRGQGASRREAAERLKSLSIADKNELLFAGGINVKNLPNWQNRGVGLFWQVEEQPAINQKTGQPTIALRRRLHIELNLPRKETYEQLVLEIIQRG